jgi:hypothetical protein
MAGLNKAVDADFLGEVVNASSTVDAGDVGGTAGSGIALDASNVLKVCSAVLRKLSLKDIDITGQQDPRPLAGNMKPGGQAGYAAVNPYFKEQLTLSLAGRETADGDMIGKNGYVNRYNSFDNYVTTNGTWTGTLGIATAPSDGDTVVINGVTFTFKTALTPSAGEVLIDTTADNANTNLAALINTPGTTTSKGVALTAANQALLKRITATANLSPNTLTLVAEGYGYVVTSETLSATADVWSSEISHQMFGQKGAVDMVVAVEPKVSVSDIPLQLGKYVKPHVLYGLKTFVEGADALVNVKIDSSTWA